MSGIVAYGAYVPEWRITTEEIASVWKKDAGEVISSLKIHEKAVPQYDEDAVTLAVEASIRAFDMAGFGADRIESIYVGSESHPYAVNPSSTIIAEYLGILGNYFASDLEFACKAGTAAMQITQSFVDSGKINYGLILGSDTAQAKPQNALEFSAASGAAAYIIGKKKSEVIAEIIETISYSTDTPDFWRRDGSRFPLHAGRFTGEPAYFSHIMSSAKELFKRTKSDSQDYDYCVFHMPNGKFPRTVAKKLGFSDAQLAPSLVVDVMGNPYSASSLMGLASVLDIAKPNQKIFFVSYGSGAGSDAFVFQTTQNLINKRKRVTPIMEMLSNKTYISYVDYLKQTYLHLL